MGVYGFLDSIENFLAIVLFESSYVYIDFWTLVHFCSGVILMFLFFRYARVNFGQGNWLMFPLLFVLLVIWELYEYSVYSVGGWIVAETPADVGWDLVSGMAGGFLVWFLKRG